MTPSPTLSFQLATTNQREEWDNYVSTHEQATAYHKFAWLLAVKNAYGHAIFGVIARETPTNKVVGVFPAILMKAPIIGRQLCSLPYCDVGYPVANSPEIIREMQSFLETQQIKHSSQNFEIRDIAETPTEATQLQHKKVRMLLPLPESSETLLASFKSKLRSQVRKAEKNGLEVKVGNTQQLINEFYDVYARNMRDLGSPVHAKKWFEHIASAYTDSCIISVVYKGDTPIGAGLVIKNGKHASIPWASTLREFNPLAPNMMLYWSLLAHCADSGITEFDFGRSTFEEGTYRFKKQWGATPQLLNWKKLDKNNQYVKEKEHSQTPSKLRPLIENVWRKLPLGLTITTGSVIRPYISL
ncbi:GNAT family N-acetyltransferase [Alteromonas sp. 1_MG-2023]|uniref:GNAT family N-acetyltransferase n=1 Tax=Alteromonas sp. 1_MG-2023 TaxID=3062669 RepID=UPI0026E2BBB6|nr:GNAT family N-acetyltransferase [Alteromonas sp. 1_MG-2023]MDO6566319.1 GNAT family N-acetyltransferase [Alteromonas sp. 1_MG-2023]